MKSTEEYKKEYLSLAWLCDSANAHDAAVLDLFKQIQLDAMREGMRRAAKIVMPYNKALVGEEARKLISKTILSAAEKLTEKDL